MTAAEPTVERRSVGVALALGGMVLLSTDSVLARWADTDGVTVAFWVGALSAVVLLGGRRGAGVRRGGAPLVAAAALQGATILAFVLAVKHTAIANVAAIVAAAPLAAALAALALLGERPSHRAWTAIAVSGAGVALIVGGSTAAASSGDLYAVGAIVAFGVQTAILRRDPHLDRWAVVGVGGALLAIATAPFAQLGGHDLTTWAALAAMGAVVGPLSRGLLASASRHLPATEVGLFAPVETVLATTWAYLAFDEVPATATWLGGAAIVSAALWATWPRSAAGLASAGPS